MTVLGAVTPHPIASPVPTGPLARFGRYEIVDELGHGGMGVVYKARDTRLGRFVAVKVLPPSLSDDKVARERFLQEARAASAIDHQNICTIFDIGTTDQDELFIVMAHYDGQTLKERLDRGTVETREFIDISAQIADALQAAHDVGIIHRDIKPSNVLLCRNGLVKVLDFGLARRFSGEDEFGGARHGLDTPGCAFGTPNYMAPERILEMPVDYRSDLFSLGVVMYEMATLRRPFAAPSAAETAMKVLDHDPEPIRTFSPHCPEFLERVITRALAKEPRDRFQSASELRRALTGARIDVELSRESSHEAVDSTPTGSAMKVVGMPGARHLLHWMTRSRPPTHLAATR